MQGVAVVRSIHFWPAVTDQEARSNNNPGPIAAIITRVWDADHGLINLTAFPDNFFPILRSSIRHRSEVENKPDFKEGLISYWDWPERK